MKILLLLTFILGSNLSFAESTDGFNRLKLNPQSGTEVTLGANTETKRKGSNGLNLEIGVVRVVTDKKFTVYVNNKSIHGSNAEFFVEKTRDQTVVGVFSGTVQFFGRTLNTSESMVLYHDGQSNPPSLLDSGAFDYWARNTFFEKTTSSKSRFRVLKNPWRKGKPIAVDTLNPYASRSEFQFMSLGLELFGRISRDNVTNLYSQTYAMALSSTIVPTKFYLVHFEGLAAARLGHKNEDKDGSLHLQQGFWLARTEDNHSVAVGRQIWNFGDGLIIGEDSWSHVRRSFDGMLFTLRPRSVRVRVLGATLGDRISSTKFKDFLAGTYLNLSKFPIELYGFWVKRADISSSEVINIAKSTRASYWTFGGKTEMHPVSFFFIKGEAAAQIGKVELNQKSEKLGSFLARAQAGFHSSFGKTHHKIAGEFIEASGDKNPGDERTNSFLELFPNSRQFLGVVNQFSQLRNIQKISASYLFRFQVLKYPTHLKLEQMFFRRPQAAESAFPLVSDRTEKDLGSELDIQLGFEPIPAIQLKFGGGIFTPGKAFLDKKKQKLYYLLAQMSL